MLLEAYWFVISKKEIHKTAYFFAPVLYISGVYSFALLGFAVQHRNNLRQQARHSRGLTWNSRGSLSHEEVETAFEEIFERLSTRPADLLFLAKGLEKCSLLEYYVPLLENSEESSCPVFDLWPSWPRFH